MNRPVVIPLVALFAAIALGFWLGVRHTAPADADSAFCPPKNAKQTARVMLHYFNGAIPETLSKRDWDLVFNALLSKHPCAANDQ